MAGARVPTARVGEMWQVPENSVITGPHGTCTVTGGVFCLQLTGTYTNDTGDAVTVVAEDVPDETGGDD